jgi:uncharacterized protein
MITDNIGKKTLPFRVHILAKPTGAACNLDCAYCFFLEKEKLYPGSRFRMNDTVLEAYISQLTSAQTSNQVSIAWQGGEPTLMGIDFYRRAIELQQFYGRPGMTRSQPIVYENSMQTNGTLLNDDWCRFFKEHNFLIGISLDGPAFLHDRFRRSKSGHPTFKQVMRGVRLLQKHGVDHNILVAVNKVNADYPKEVYRFLRDEVRANWIQFIPVIERLNPHGERSIVQDGTVLSDRSVQPAQFGRFLSTIFDEWVSNDVGSVFIQTFEAAIRNHLNLPSSGMCVFEKTCGLGLALEHNGDLYSCDHFVEPAYLLGNILETPLVKLVLSEKQKNFGLAKHDSLPALCLDCKMLFACKGECPKNRFMKTVSGEPGLNYLCEGWRHFFEHSFNQMNTIASLLRAGHSAAEIMAKSNLKRGDKRKSTAKY